MRIAFFSVSIFSARVSLYKEEMSIITLSERGIALFPVLYFVELKFSVESEKLSKDFVPEKMS